jgi:hypothetical protein
LRWPKKAKERAKVASAFRLSTLARPRSPNLGPEGEGGVAAKERIDSRRGRVAAPPLLGRRDGGSVVLSFPTAF